MRQAFPSRIWLLLVSMLLTARSASTADLGRLIRSHKDALDQQRDAVDRIKGDEDDLRVGDDGDLDVVLTDAREKAVGIGALDDKRLRSFQQCNSMPSGYCCGMSPKMIRLETSSHGECACSGPQKSGHYTTQAAIDNYCNQVMQPCEQLSHVACCGMSPQMIRVSDDSDMCWCSGPHGNDDSLYNTQASITDWCSEVIRPCSGLSTGHCCHLQPAQLLQGSGNACYCSGPLTGSNVTSQLLIDKSCQEVIQPCEKLSRAACCGLNPPQVRYNDGAGKCWCSGPVQGEDFEHQTAIEDWCGAVAGSAATSLVKQSPAPSTAPETKPCNELSEAQCCASAPKRFRLQLGDNRCMCSSTQGHGVFYTQQAVDTHCAMTVRLCDDLTEEECCAASRAKVGIDNRGEQIAVGTGSDAFCACTDAQLHGRIAHHEVIANACQELVTSCHDLTQGDCCLKSPKQIRQESGDNCWCVPLLKEDAAVDSLFKSQKDVDDMCDMLVKSCDVLLEEDCCAFTPKQVRVQDSSGRCYCRGPHLAGEKNWDQQSIDQSCREVPAKAQGPAQLDAPRKQQTRAALGQNPLLVGVPASLASQDEEAEVFQLNSRHSSLPPSLEQDLM